MPSQGPEGPGAPRSDTAAESPGLGETDPLPHPSMGKWRQDELQPQLLVLPQVHHHPWHQHGGLCPGCKDRTWHCSLCMGGTGGAG